MFLSFFIAIRIESALLAGADGTCSAIQEQCGIAAPLIENQQSSDIGAFFPIEQTGARDGYCDAMRTVKGGRQGLCKAENDLIVNELVDSGNIPKSTR